MNVEADLQEARTVSVEADMQEARAVNMQEARTAARVCRGIVQVCR